jgi:serine/threonine-protein kinase
LKPANILLDAAGRPFVSDFGLAKVPRGETPATRAGTIIGTPNYMPPEQAAGHVDEIDERSDVYSLGAILYETLTGRPPFREASPLDTLVQVLEGEPTLPRQLERRIPRELEWICLRALEKNPADRYPTAAALADDLERCLRQDAIEARPSRWWHRLRRWSRREPALALRLGGVAVAAVVLQIIWFTVGENLRYHFTNLVVLAVWAASAVAFRWLLGRSGANSWAPYAWLSADVTLLTTLLCLAPGPLGPLLVGYPLLIAASGLFSQVRLVWFTTALTLAAYLSLEWLRADPGPQPHYRYFFVAVLAILGFVVSFQVRRVRALARYYETRRGG